MNGERRSILADLAVHASNSREVIATWGLGHLLRASPMTRASLSKLLTPPLTALDDLEFFNEEIDTESEGRPDVVGRAAGQRRIVLEGKFWAWPTANQPVEYLKSLSDDGCLLFVAPAKRVDTLWPEIKARCAAAGWGIDQEIAGAAVHISRVNGRWWLGIVSWRVLLDEFRRALMQAGERSTVEDVDQLDNLCDLEDEDAFLPLTPSDLTAPSANRIYQFIQLVDAIQQQGVTRNVVDKAGGTGGRSYQFIRYMIVRQRQIAIFVDFRRWAKQAATPLWLEVSVDPRDARKALEKGSSLRVTYDGNYYSRPVFPLWLPTGVEQKQVIDSVLDQVTKILDALSECRSNLGGKSSPPGALLGVDNTEPVRVDDSSMAGEETESAVV